MEFTIRGFKSHSGQLSIATSKNLSVVNNNNYNNNNNNNIYIYIYINISTFYAFLCTYDKLS